MHFTEPTTVKVHVGNEIAVQNLGKWPGINPRTATWKKVKEAHYIVSIEAFNGEKNAKKVPVEADKIMEQDCSVSRAVKEENLVGPSMVALWEAATRNWAGFS